MARKVKTEYGEMACGECGHPVKVMKSQEGGLSYNCLAWGCDSADYAPVSKPLKLAAWEKRIKKRDEAPAEDPAPVAPAPAAEPAPADPVPKAKPTNIWGL